MLRHPGLSSIVQGWEQVGEVCLGGMPASAQGFLLAALQREKEKSLLIQAVNPRQQEEVADYLAAWGLEPLVYPEPPAVEQEALRDPETQAERFAVLHILLRKNAPILVITPAGLADDVPRPGELRESTLLLERKQKLGMEELRARLEKAGYVRETLTTQRGQVSVRGGLLDCFPWQAEFPLRIEWLGDEVDSIRQFDPALQTSVKELKNAEVQLLPLLHDKKWDGSIEGYFSPVKVDLEQEAPDALPLAFSEHTFLHGRGGDEVLAENRKKLLLQHLSDWRKEAWQVFISCNNEGERERLTGWLKAVSTEVDNPELADFPHILISSLGKGFSWEEGKLVLLTDAEIFGRYQTLRGSRRQRLIRESTRAQPLDFGEIELGDYVVHLDHGIALYHGLQDLEDPTTGMKRQVMTLGFAEGARLHVPIEQAYLVSRYVGVGKAHPPLDTLGGTRWEKAKTQATKAVMDFAAELLRVQAERETMPGHVFPPDDAWQKEFEDSFLYDETPDQIKAIDDAKHDMESPRPMDRLICGDVGFGKTEVAIRAAFKAVMGGRQVAILTPTTVLAHQHFQTFRERMADYPVKVDVLSRFRTKGEQQEVMEKTATGGVDILIGTHRILSSDLKFKNLGLVVIDEEQRFGVKQKEKLKAAIRQVDVLTLSATPIPRTLYLSLVGARDMSTIETPPVNRHPVETQVAPYDERIIRDAIKRELARGGQIYFLHNRVASIDQVAARLKLLIPECKILIGHGQMKDDELEDVMRRFVRGEADLLLCTTIIESGLDIPNANTIIIDRADRFGLADLYQLRGRVGRAANRAHALLLLPRELMRTEAQKRVQAIREYSQLGAGYKIAMRDLEIRGAGSILGTAQSGHITAVGFELYCRMLKLAVESLKGKKTSQKPLAHLSLDFLHFREPSSTEEESSCAWIPLSYMQEIKWRISAHRDLAEVGNMDQLAALRRKWRDRFGKIPPPVEILLLAQRIRLVAGRLGIDRVESRESKLMLRKNEELLMVGSRFPRLTGHSVESILKNVEKWVTTLGATS